MEGSATRSTRSARGSSIRRVNQRGPSVVLPVVGSRARKSSPASRIASRRARTVPGSAAGPAEPFPGGTGWPAIESSKTWGRRPVSASVGASGAEDFGLMSDSIDVSRPPWHLGHRSQRAVTVHVEAQDVAGRLEPRRDQQTRHSVFCDRARRSSSREIWMTFETTWPGRVVFSALHDQRHVAGQLGGQSKSVHQARHDRLRPPKRTPW